MGVEAKEPQDAQIVFADAILGIVDEAQASGPQVRQAAKRIDNRAIRPRVKRIHGEVATMGVFLDRFGKGNNGPAPVRLHILAETRDFEGIMTGHNGNGAVFIAGRHRLEPRRFRRSKSLIRRGISCDIDIRNRHTQHRIAHTATNKKSLKPCIGQHGTHRLRGRICQPVIGEAHHG